MAAAEELTYLCRLCATKLELLMGLPIFEPGDQVTCIDKKIAACLPVQISITDQLPKVVCERCAFKVEELFSFREKVLQTENMFMEMLKTINKQDREEIQLSVGGFQLDGESVRLVDEQMQEENAELEDTIVLYPDRIDAHH